MLGPYKIIENVGTSYRLELPVSMKRTNVFHPSMLRPCAEDPLPGQQIPPPNPVIVDNLKWQGFHRDDNWYYVDGGEFEGAQEVRDEFHRRYPKMPQ